MADELALKVGVSGVRGVVGQGLTDRVALDFAHAFAAYAPPGAIALGRDTRTSGEMLRAAVVAALLQAGRPVVDLGVLPVPSLQMAIRLAGTLAGGVYLSASHNPGDQNGLKFYRPDGIILYPHQGEELAARWRRGERTVAAAGALGHVTSQGAAIERHVGRISAQTDARLIAQANLRVVVDCNNGAGCGCGPDLLRRLGVATVAVLNGEPTGVFAHQPEPVPEHMGQLALRVAELGYHLGFSLDPDADRAAIAACVMGTEGIVGEAIGEEYTLALGAAAVAAQAAPRGQVVSMACNYSTSRMIEETAHAHGFPFLRTPVGEINVVEGLQRLEREWAAEHPGDAHHFAFGGEGGGGIIDARNQYCRDSLNAMALILQGLAAWKLRTALPDHPRPADERLLLDSWRRSALGACAIVKDKLEFSDLDLQSRVMQAVSEHYRAAPVPPADIHTDDGVRVKYADRSWVHVRPSNTEPIVRFIAEHDTQAQARALVDAAMALARRQLRRGG